MPRNGVSTGRRTIEQPARGVGSVLPKGRKKTERPCRKLKRAADFIDARTAITLALSFNEDGFSIND
jgi:hypothetical protein